ncbi:hypothetical protein ACFYT4_34520 [Streptomyces sp. NPDC004609]|uniref:hypothetical protein n=1 Tax=Streptomyces sp. NPDC004609 TaxID=3364704 RepID=UPI00367CC74F
MDDSARMWITTVPSLDPDDVEVVLALDHTSRDPGERMVSVMMNRGHEGEAGVFYLLESDLSARYERSGDRLAVAVTASRQLLARDLAVLPEPLHEQLAALPGDASDDDRVTLLRRTIVTDFVPAEQDGEKQPVLLIGSAGPASLSELFSRFGNGEADIAVLNAG